MRDWLTNDALPLVARICLVAVFPFSGLDKIANWDNALKQAASSFLPGAPVLLVLAMMVEFGTPICIVSGWHGGLAAVVLAGYCAITAILYHNFWTYPRFWSPDSAGYPHVWDFLKNFGLVGGLLLLILGSGLAQAETAARENCQTVDRASDRRAAGSVHVNPTGRDDLIQPIKPERS
jgi:putative oxidoreductase